DGAHLFQSDVPVDTDAGEFGHLLAPQARGATPPHARQSHRLRAQPLAPGAQEIAEFTALRVRHRREVPKQGFSNPRIIPGLVETWKPRDDGLPDEVSP